MNDQMVVVNGVRVRRDEAAALGIKIPGAAASVPAPETSDDDDEQTKTKPAPRKARTPANKQRRNVANK